jgi:hypothetical protein
VWLWSFYLFGLHSSPLPANLSDVVSIIVHVVPQWDVSPCPLVRQAAYGMRSSNGCTGRDSMGQQQRVEGGSLHKSSNGLEARLSTMAVFASSP